MAAISGWEAVIANVGDSCAYMDTGVEVVLVSFRCDCLCSAVHSVEILDAQVIATLSQTISSGLEAVDISWPFWHFPQPGCECSAQPFSKAVSDSCLRQLEISTAPDHSTFECR